MLKSNKIYVMLCYVMFIYIYTLSKQRWYFSLRASKAHIAMDNFTFIKKTLIKEYVQAVLNLQDLMIPQYLIF